jgi:hypothetical protein
MKKCSKCDALLVNMLFTKLKIICPAWRHAWPTQKIYNLSKMEWIKAMRDADVNNADSIESGLKKLRKRDCPFIPAVGEFVAMCHRLSPVKRVYVQEAAVVSNIEVVESALRGIKDVLRAAHR